MTNAVSWCQKCAQDRRSEVVGFDVMSHVALRESCWKHACSRSWGVW